MPGGPEVLLILLLAVLLFGANKIPKLARSTGQAMGEFQKGRQQVEEELEEMKEGEGPTAESSPASEGTPSTETARTSTETADAGTDATETDTTSK
nr:twin-arginine translocase TatA/TatE family subunit [Halorhabdus amylolytica]